MKSRKISLDQYSFLTKNLEGDTTDFLELVSSHIGHLIIEFNLLEERLTSFIWMLISERTDSKGVLLTHGINYSAKVDLFNRYSKHIQDAYHTEILIHDKQIANLKECARLRNIVVHAEWRTVDLEGFAFTKFHFKNNNIQQEFVQLDEDSLVKIRNFIIETYNLFDDYDEMYSEILQSRF